MTRQSRTFTAEIRAVPGSNGRQFWTMPVAYDVVDDYGTIWNPGVFGRSVEEKLPALMYGHAGWNDIDQVMGGAIDYRDGDRGPEALYELLDFDAQPKARIFAALIEDRGNGSKPFMRDMSVGFERWEWTGPGGVRDLDATDREMRGRLGRPAVERMLAAGWDETSLVVAGAVPGAQALTGARMVQTRSGLTVAMDDVVELAKRKAAGKLTDEEAQEALRILGGGDETWSEENSVTVDGDATEQIEDDTDDVLAEADEVLEQLES